MFQLYGLYSTMWDRKMAMNRKEIRFWKDVGIKGKAVPI